MIAITEFYVHNSLNVSTSVKFNLTLRYFVIKSEQGEHCWTLEIGTTHSGINGEDYLSKKVHAINAQDLDEVIEGVISELCSKIDWSPYVVDNDPPYITDISPAESIDVPIGSTISFNINENLPAAGIDLSEMVITLNNSTSDFDITDEVAIIGDPYKYSVSWAPILRVYDTYD